MPAVDGPAPAASPAEGRPPWLRTANSPLSAPQDAQGPVAEGKAPRTGSGDRASKPGILERVNIAINGSIERVFDKIGRFVARRPIITIVAALMFAAIFIGGTALLENESRCASSSAAHPFRGSAHPTTTHPHAFTYFLARSVVCVHRGDVTWRELQSAARLLGLLGRLKRLPPA